MDQADNTCAYWPNITSQRGQVLCVSSCPAIGSTYPPLKSSCQKMENLIKALVLIMFPGNRTEKQIKLHHGDTIGKNSHWEILQTKDLVSSINKLQGEKIGEPID